MTHKTPRWIGGVGFVLLMVFSMATIAGEMWVALVSLIPLFALVVLETRYPPETEDADAAPLTPSEVAGRQILRGLSGAAPGR